MSMDEACMNAPAASGGAAKRRDLAHLTLAYVAAFLAALLCGYGLRQSHPVLVAALADLAATAVVFAFSVRHDNSSIYDPYWSVASLPICLYWSFTGPGALAMSWRPLLVLLLVALWSVRLTANCLGRWGGLGDEDFRYREIRQRTGRAYWPVSFLGIHLAPSVWVFLGTLPLYPLLALPGRALSALDLAAAIVTAGALALEAVADRQLHAFVRRRRDAAEVLDSGVWAWSRHPNYLGEILFWWGLFLFGIAAEPRWAWSVVGPIAITMLFVFISVPWMDRRMVARHPAWAARMRTTAALLPLRTGKKRD
jgi:steroid 5-alpha reductase family enzyme